MTKKLTPRDLNALSAYLDDELSPRERSRLESRLQRDSELRQALEQLGQTRRYLRRLPRQRAPRSFALRPEMVEVQPWYARFVPRFQWASALATILLVAVLVGDLTGALQPATLLRTAQPEPAVMLESEMTTEMAEVEPPGEEAVEEEALQAAEDMEQREGFAPSAAEAGTPAPLETGDAVQAEILGTPTPEVLTPPVPTLAATPPLAPLETAPGVSALRVAELVLGLFALTTGLTALFLRRRIAG